MRDLLELLIRLKWWFYGDHLRYDKYYDIARIRKLGLDPRANRRAHFKGEIALILGLLVSCEIAMLVLEQHLRFDPKLGPPVLNLTFPFLGLPYNTMNWAFTSYANAHLNAIVHGSFAAAWTAFGYGFVASIIWSNRVYMSSRWDRTDLTTELGTARWATPDELTDKRGSLLPEGYDAIFGFSKAARARMKRNGQLLPIAIPTAATEPEQKTEAWRAMLIAALCSLGTFLGSMPTPIAAALTIGAAALFGYTFRDRIGSARSLYFTLGGSVAGIAIAGVFAHGAGAALPTALCGTGIGAIIGMFASLISTANVPLDLSAKTITPATVVGIIVYGIGNAAHEPIAITAIAGTALALLMLIQPKRLQPVLIAAAIGAALPFVAKAVPGSPAIVNDPSRFALTAAAAVAAFIVAQSYISPKETTA